MNPETNKFEKLIEETDQVKEIQSQIDRLSGELYRPNGEKVPKHWSLFQVGENYIINNYTFQCKYIGETSILFEPVGIVGVITENK